VYRYDVDNRPYLQALENDKRLAEAINLIAAHLGIEVDTAFEDLAKGLDMSHMYSSKVKDLEKRNFPLKKLKEIDDKNVKAINDLVQFINDQKIPDLESRKRDRKPLRRIKLKGGRR
jgi:hypothetical protein